MKHQWTRRSLLAGLVSGMAGCSSNSATNNETSSQSQKPSVDIRSFPDSFYQGPLVSAHEHMAGPDGYLQETEELNKFTRLMERNGIARAAAFAPSANIGYVDDFPDRLIPFLFAHEFMRNHPDEFATRMSEYASGLSSIRGLGEFGLYGVTGDDGLPHPPDSPQMLEIYHAAAQQEIPVMVHGAEPWAFPESVRNSWESNLECPTIDQMATAYEHNRETEFIVHGTYFEAENTSRAEMVAEALSNHPNLYYDISPIAPYAYFNGLMGSGSMTKDKFQSKMEANGIQQHADRYYERFKLLLENHSDRLLWGMDAAYEWHYTEWAIDTWVDISRALLGRLPEEKARNIGFRTAEEVFDIEITSRTNTE